MSFFQTSGEGSDNLSLAVQNHVRNESQASSLRCVQHVFMNGIVLKNAWASVRRIDELTAVVCHDCFVRRNSGEHGFPAARKAGKQMWLNKAFRKQEVRFGCGPVDDALSPGRKRADFNHGGV